MARDPLTAPSAVPAPAAPHPAPHREGTLRVTLSGESAPAPAPETPRGDGFAWPLAACRECGARGLHEYPGGDGVRCDTCGAPNDRPAPALPSTAPRADPRPCCAACGKLAEGECTCPKSTPGYYHPDPAIDAEIREEAARRDAFDVAHGIRPGWHRGSAAEPSAPAAPADAGPSDEEYADLTDEALVSLLGSIAPSITDTLRARLRKYREALAELARGWEEHKPHHMTEDLAACLPDCEGCVSGARWDAALELARALSRRPR